jgi:hypothetical protein
MTRTEPGELGALLRREGLYSSLLAVNCFRLVTIRRSVIDPSSASI